MFLWAAVQQPMLQLLLNINEKKEKEAKTTTDGFPCHMDLYKNVLIAVGIMAGTINTDCFIAL